MTKIPDCNTYKISFDMGGQETAPTSQKIKASTCSADLKGGTLKTLFPHSIDGIKICFQIQHKTINPFFIAMIHMP